MIMIMVIINHSDDDGDHSNIARLSLTDDIDDGDKEQDFISMILYGAYGQFSWCRAAYIMSYVTDNYQLRKDCWLY